MDGNKLRSRVALYLPDPAQDAQGQATGARVLLDVVAANVRYDSGVAAIRAGADLSVVHASIRIRYRAAALGVKWAKHNQTTFNVQSVLPDENRQQWMDLACEVAT